MTSVPVWPAPGAPGRVWAIAVAMFLGLHGLASAQQVSLLPRLVLEDEGGGSVARLLDQTGSSPISLAIRFVLPAPAVDASLEAHLAAARGRELPLWLSVPAPSTADAIDGWRAALARLIERTASSLAVIEVVAGGQPEPVLAFALQVAATEARTRRAGVLVAIGGAPLDDPVRRPAIYTPELAPYVDLLVLGGARAADDTVEWLERLDPGARLVLSSREGLAGQDASQVLVESLIRDLGTPVVARILRARDVTSASLQAVSALSDVLDHDLSVLDPAAVELRLMVGSQDVTASLDHRLLFDTETFSTLLVYGALPAASLHPAGASAPQHLDVSLRVPVEGTPGVRDLLTGERSLAGDYAREAGTERTRARVPLTGRPMLVNFNEGATAVVEGTGVTAERQLSVGEIISRHQQQQLAQDRFVRQYTADARMRQHFRPTITDPGYDIVTENRYFVAQDGVEWEELSFAVNGAKWGADRPPLPMLQPEKVLSLPLQLRFDEGYRYTLQGTVTVDGFDCYELRFEPVRNDPSLYRGRVWIDRRTFARVRVQAVQGALSGMVMSNEETLTYAPVPVDGHSPVFLFTSLTGRQLVLLAGRNILIEKSVTFDNFRVNDVEFDELRTAARRSDRVMFRETAAGLRHYVKRDGERVVSDRPTAGVKAMAMGVMVDPSYAFPLPIVGINYVDFGFVNQETQLAMLFAGVLAAGNIQRPQLGSRRLSASIDFFAIAAPSSDRVYDASGEREAERVLTWPLSTGLNLGWQATPYQKLSFQYQLRFDAYVRDITTAETFQPPSSTVTNGIGGSWEYSRGGYTVTLNGARFVRSRWRPWGADAPVEGMSSTPRAYTKYSASVSRDFFLNMFQKVNVNAAWFGGRDLDRFVQYQFGMFDATRIHGVPAAVRFGELAVARATHSVNLFDQYRLDLFGDHAWGRDEAGIGWQRIPGVGAAFNLRAPWNTILRADIGRSWLPDRYQSLGSTTVQIMLLKPL